MPKERRREGKRMKKVRHKIKTPGGNGWTEGVRELIFVKIRERRMWEKKKEEVKGFFRASKGRQRERTNKAGTCGHKKEKEKY